MPPRAGVLIKQVRPDCCQNMWPVAILTKLTPHHVSNHSGSMFLLRSIDWREDSAYHKGMLALIQSAPDGISDLVLFDCCNLLPSIILIPSCTPSSQCSALLEIHSWHGPMRGLLHEPRQIYMMFAAWDEPGTGLLHQARNNRQPTYESHVIKQPT